METSEEIFQPATHNSKKGFASLISNSDYTEGYHPYTADDKCSDNYVSKLRYLSFFDRYLKPNEDFKNATVE